ncbi:hypothetical protein MNEG_13642 [Monoraphidium neglectum]|uniref:Uncharacterized protein n=1 Tax=Monoraphidium neglectum TaxID=145388 RepID=A0A0D2LRM0_9CHLO|nr:hypothetical protein MNEG_13642 [Monoraphidium neglectum]KIY94319.1 hypothetical protein MNEG_13642 [Monoraphidium neglectum]|eukprot:XP_013893339.1 hypothetical protein MNEG_13642 [Monoraphidium neglectum]
MRVLLRHAQEDRASALNSGGASATEGDIEQPLLTEPSLQPLARGRSPSVHSLPSRSPPPPPSPNGGGSAALDPPPGAPSFSFGGREWDGPISPPSGGGGLSVMHGSYNAARRDRVDRAAARHGGAGPGPGPGAKGPRAPVTDPLASRPVTPLAREVKWYVRDAVALRDMITGSYFNFLLVCVPLGFAAWAGSWGAVPVFVLNFLALVPLALLLGDVTEDLAVGGS